MTSQFEIINHKNVKITNNSVVLRSHRIVTESVVASHALKNYQNRKFLLKYILPSLPFARKNQNYILITDEWSKNYCHWLWEALSKLLVLQKQDPLAILILPKGYLKINFVMKALEAFGVGIDKIITINKKSNLKVSNLAFIGCINIGTKGYYDFLKFSEIRNQITNHFAQDLKLDLGDRIYISRSDPAKNTARKVANEKEVESCLKKYGFKTVYMENYNFLEQVSIANHAKYIVSPHGAGITNVMFMKDGGWLLELVHQDWQKTCFAEMLERMNISYIKQDCQAENQQRTMHLVDIVVDVLQLEKNLNSIFK